MTPSTPSAFLAAANEFSNTGPLSDLLKSCRETLAFYKQKVLEKQASLLEAEKDHSDIQIISNASMHIDQIEKFSTKKHNFNPHYKEIREEYLRLLSGLLADIQKGIHKLGFKETPKSHTNPLKNIKIIDTNVLTTPFKKSLEELKNYRGYLANNPSQELSKLLSNAADIERWINLIKNNKDAIKWRAATREEPLSLAEDALLKIPKESKSTDCLYVSPQRYMKALNSRLYATNVEGSLPQHLYYLKTILPHLEKLIITNKTTQNPSLNPEDIIATSAHIRRIREISDIVYSLEYLRVCNDLLIDQEKPKVILHKIFSSAFSSLRDKVKEEYANLSKSKIALSNDDKSVLLSQLNLTSIFLDQIVKLDSTKAERTTLSNLLNTFQGEVKILTLEKRIGINFDLPYSVATTGTKHTVTSAPNHLTINSALTIELDRDPGNTPKIKVLTISTDNAQQASAIPSPTAPPPLPTSSKPKLALFQKKAQVVNKVPTPLAPTNTIPQAPPLNNVPIKNQPSTNAVIKATQNQSAPALILTTTTTAQTQKQNKPSKQAKTTAKSSQKTSGFKPIFAGLSISTGIALMLLVILLGFTPGVNFALLGAGAALAASGLIYCGYLGLQHLAKSYRANHHTSNPGRTTVPAIEIPRNTVRTQIAVYENVNTHQDTKISAKSQKPLWNKSKDKEEKKPAQNKKAEFKK